MKVTFDGAECVNVGGFSVEPVSIEDATICAARQRRVIDASGFMILPGIVDLHGDGFERHLAPRRGANSDPQLGLRALETELAACGITTAWLAQFWSWEGGMRGPKFARMLCEAVSQTSSLLDLRVQLRFEYGLHGDIPELLSLIDEFGISYVVLNDHLPHAQLSSGKRPPRLEGQALKAGRSAQDHRALLEGLHADFPAAREAAGTLCAALIAHGVLIGSHDDPTPDERAYWRQNGARISEFPMSLGTAKTANREGDPVIGGAPNVVRGGSHKRAASVRDMIAAGACDALVSDYHYPSLHLAAFKLADEGMPFKRAWSYVSAQPAKIMGLPDRGAIKPGARADIVFIEKETRRICGTVANGRFVHLTAPLAERLL